MNLNEIINKEAEKHLSAIDTLALENKWTYLDIEKYLEGVGLECELLEYEFDNRQYHIHNKATGMSWGMIIYWPDEDSENFVEPEQRKVTNLLIYT